MASWGSSGSGPDGSNHRRPTSYHRHVTAVRAFIGERVSSWGRGLTPAIALLGFMAFIVQVGVSIMLPLLPNT